MIVLTFLLHLLAQVEVVGILAGFLFLANFLLRAFACKRYSGSYMGFTPLFGGVLLMNQIAVDYRNLAAKQFIFLGFGVECLITLYLIDMPIGAILDFLIYILFRIFFSGAIILIGILELFFFLGFFILKYRALKPLLNDVTGEQNTALLNLLFIAFPPAFYIWLLRKKRAEH